eukprot:692299-Pelagomonas_calceolata.AAC.5
MCRQSSYTQSEHMRVTPSEFMHMKRSGYMNVTQPRSMHITRSGCMRKLDNTLLRIVKDTSV